VVFDFDNTLVCGDIGEATLAVLTARGKLDPARMAPAVSPSFRRADGRCVRVADGPDLTAYYEAFLTPTVHGGADRAPLSNGYIWAVEAMGGLCLADVVEATAAAYACSTQGQLHPIDVTPGQTAYPAPFFYPESVELVAALLRHKFDVWIASASNVWSVRWMVRHGLNPLLRQLGLRRGVAPQHILGVATLLADKDERLYKDACLVRENASYARLEDPAVAGLRLTTRLEFPVPTYSGKVAALWDALGRHPFLVAGDSPGDHAMLTFGEYRLWIARMDKPGYQQTTASLARAGGFKKWIVQPVLSRIRPGFMGGREDLAGLPVELAAAIGQSARLWRPARQTNRG
jgi:hypothetical protein